jgi:hypothetical protein
MAYENRPGDGVLFPNENRNKDTSPTMTGFVIAHRDIKAGEKLNLAAWTKQARTKFLSLKMSDPRGTETERPADDEIPF